ncbi:HET domain-containing protein [Microdochium nivale]|nr:HET domain-containing protein [Microdochium nivale]
MTSLQWQPGHIYGTTREPRYNAISYTWGRFREDRSNISSQLTHRGLDINGVEWNIPPINSQHFSRDEFRTVLERIASLDPDEQCDFVWVDIACIDQRSDSVAGALEVGRQAAIFKGASKVGVWLTTTEDDWFERVWMPTTQDGSSMFDSYFVQGIKEVGKEEQFIKLVETIMTSVSAILSDPWFSSLWTLQESALCPEAVMLGRPGNIIGYAGFRTFECFRGGLVLIHEHCTLILSTRKGSVYAEHPRIATVVERLRELIRDSGMPQLDWGDIMALYSAAGKRKVTETTDCVYAIQQVFGYRLGKTAETPVGSRPNTSWSLQQLEVELGKRLITDFPVNSQMHVFTSPQPRGSAWRVARSSRLPIPLAGTGETSTNVWEYDLEQWCTLTAEKIHGTWLGRFDGHICAFKDMNKLWLEANASAPGIAPGEFANCQRIMLDAADQASLRPGEPAFYRTPGQMRDMWPGDEQVALARWLIQEYDTGLVVLRLGGLIKGGFSVFGETVGLILQRMELVGTGSYYWKRLGFCYWLTATSPVEPGDRVIGDFQPIYDADLWQTASGYFG